MAGLLLFGPGLPTSDCTTDNILVQPLHISDHFFITFTLHLQVKL